jgi:hypothetical protein
MDDERLQDRRGVVNRPGCGFGQSSQSSESALGS